MTRVLLIGGTDSSGGAGLSRDVATAATLGAEAAPVVTAVTAQTDAGVRAVHPIPPETVAEQIRTAGLVGAVKTGMLADAATVCAVAEALPRAPLVVDPVLAASSGRALLDAAGICALIDRLIPHAALLTPNLPEFARLIRLLGTDGSERDGIRALLGLGCGAVLLKGGHAQGKTCEDRLYLAKAPDDPVHLRGPRRPVCLRGTGCRLATTIATRLAAGDGLVAAVTAARQALDAAFVAARRHERHHIMHLPHGTDLSGNRQSG